MWRIWRRGRNLFSWLFSVTEILSTYITISGHIPYLDKKNGKENFVKTMAFWLKFLNIFSTLTAKYKLCKFIHDNSEGKNDYSKKLCT